MKYLSILLVILLFFPVVASETGYKNVVFNGANAEEKYEKHKALISDCTYKDVIFNGANGAQLVGRVFIPAEQNGKGIVLYHGFGGNCEGFYSDRLPIAQRLVSMGYTVLTYDHRAHEHSTGDFDFEYLVEDAMTAITMLQSYGVTRIGVTGHSMGGMIAILVSAYDPRVECTVAWAAPKSVDSAVVWVLKENLITETTDEDFLAAINKVYGTNLPTEGGAAAERGPVDVGKLHTTLPDLLHFFAQSQTARYKPIVQVGKTNFVRFVHGTEDPTVNPDDSVEMYNFAGYPKDLLFIPGGKHGAEGHEEEFVNAIVSWFTMEF
jgi:pimeloyl-ACP methyl ester carboxylesterase